MKYTIEIDDLMTDSEILEMIHNTKKMFEKVLNRNISSEEMNSMRKRLEENGYRIVEDGFNFSVQPPSPPKGHLIREGETPSGKL